MNKTETGEIRRSNVRARMYQPAAMLVHGIASMPAKNAGALMAVSGIADAIPLIHGPAGCASLRQMNSFATSGPASHTPCTDLSEIDLVLGGETRLYRGIIDLYNRLKPALIVVIPTCPSDMICDDLAGIVDNAKREVGCEVIYSTGEMIQGRPIGYHDVMVSLVEQLMLPRAPFETIEGSVNLINFPIGASENKFTGIISVLEEMGVVINQVCFQNTHLSDLYELPKAELNIVDTPSPWVERMKDHFGIDYLAALSFGSDPDLSNPFGTTGAARFLLEIIERLGLGSSAVNLVEEKKKEAMKNNMELREKLKGVKIAVLDGLSLGPGVIMMRDLGMVLEAISYRSFFMKSHGMSDAAYEQLIEMDIEAARRYGCEPKILREPTPEEEIRLFKDLGVDLVLSNGGIARYNAEGIRGFSGTAFLMQSMVIGFDSTRVLAESIIDVLNTSVKRYPLTSMIEKDTHEPTLIPEWKRLGLIWRSITQGGDGGCLYG
jgi:nitrogenase molybdenum-cofactor synthesis protein NifE